MKQRRYGESIREPVAAGVVPSAGVFDERQVRTAAGLTLAVGGVAFAFAALAKIHLPIRVVTAVFAVDFAIRVAAGLRFSPFGVLSRWITRGGAPQWTSAKPKRFAWSLGLVMASAMTLITNVGIRGALPMTICTICLVLMWMEAVLGLCLGCAIYGALLRRGWIARDAAIEICPNGACTAPRHPEPHP